MFNTLFLQPIYNTVLFFVNIVPNHDIGIAIILTTLLVKLILLPLNLSAQRSTYLMKEVQIEIDEIKAKHKEDKKKLAEETMALYKKKKINPLSSIFTLIIQIPVFFALYFVFIDGVIFKENLIYSFIQFPTNLTNLAFGVIDLTKRYWFLGVLTGITMYIFSKRQADAFKNVKENKETDKNKEADFKTIFAKNMQMQMTYVLPVISGVSAAMFPAVIGIYWVVNNILNIIQDVYIKRKLNIEKFVKEHSK